MLKNYFVLNRLIFDLNNRLAGSVLYSAFSQEKDKLILEGRNNTGTFFLELSVNPQFQYIVIKDKFTRAKKNVVSLFENLLPFKNIKISIAALDRIIKISADNGNLFFFFRGNNTNVIVQSTGYVAAFKKADDRQLSSLIKEFHSLEYIYDFTEFYPAAVVDDYNRKYPFIGKDILTEAKLRDNENLQESIISVLSDIRSSKPAVYNNEREIRLAFEGFRTFSGWEKETFESLSDAINRFIIKKYSSGYFFDRKKQLLDSLSKELERISSRLNNLKGRLEKGSREEEYNKTANLLLINLHKFEKGSPNVQVEDLYSNNEIITIKTDPSLSPRQNAERYFEKSRNEKISYIKSKELYDSSLKKYNRLREEYVRLSDTSSPEELKTMGKNKITSTAKDSDDLSGKFRQYLIDGKYKLYVGRDSEKNDLLTTRFAKQNDYWFHARGVSGSHVVLRVENTKEPVPRPVLKKAASIAAFHSKAKTASMAPVSYTLKKYVSKRKGMEKGKVSLQREDVLLVKPEVPAGCEYISGE